MKTILLACGTGIVTSTAVNAKLTKALNEKGWEGKYKIKQCKIAEVPAQSENADLCVATTMVSGDVKCKVIQGVCFLTGMGTEPVLANIIAELEK
jgi:PTS system galactitol-specific IIB component